MLLQKLNGKTIEYVSESVIMVYMKEKRKSYE